MPEFDSLKSPTCSWGGGQEGGAAGVSGGNTEVADNNHGAAAALVDTKRLRGGREDADSGNFPPGNITKQPAQSGVWTPGGGEGGLGPPTLAS